jgi:hypothetical protein
MYLVGGEAPRIVSIVSIFAVGFGPPHPEDTPLPCINGRRLSGSHPYQPKVKSIIFA